MRLVVKKTGHTVTELNFSKGPVRIGRSTDNQVVLPDRAVSRQHAVLFAGDDGQWTLEDLDSANKTYLNNKIIHQAQVENGDSLRIGAFTIEIDLLSEAEGDEPINLEDTLVSAPSAPQTIIRKPGIDHAPDIILPARRARDYLRATEAICKSNTTDEILETLLNILLTQLNAHRVWGALRIDPTGPMTCHAGKTRHDDSVKVEDIELSDKIKQAVEERVFLLLPQVRGRMTNVPISSAIVAPVTDMTGCFGVLYLDNTSDDVRYTLSDLDYLMLLAIHSAVIIENF